MQSTLFCSNAVCIVSPWQRIYFSVRKAIQLTVINTGTNCSVFRYHKRYGKERRTIIWTRSRQRGCARWIGVGCYVLLERRNGSTPSDSLGSYAWQNRCEWPYIATQKVNRQPRPYSKGSSHVGVEEKTLFAVPNLANIKELRELVYFNVGFYPDGIVLKIHDQHLICAHDAARDACAYFRE